MDNRFLRNEMLIGKENQENLKNAKVILFGVGGVGSFVAEALARSGVGHLTLVDCDDVDVTNLNRQLHAVEHTVGQDKATVMQKRILSICKETNVEVKNVFYLPERAAEFDFSQYDYMIDAIDTVSAKIDLCVQAKKYGVPIISCMGTGNKLHPELLKVADVFDTKVCPLCRVMRRELKKRNIDHLKVVYSEEEPITPAFQPEGEEKRAVPGSMPFVPPAAGILIASQVVLDLIEKAEPPVVRGGRK